MPFDETTIDTEILAVHGALIPGGDQGRVLLFGGDEHNPANEEPKTDTGWRKTRVYDIATRDLVSEPIPSPDSDVFCAGHAFLPDGRLLIAGGTSEWGEDAEDHPDDDDDLHHVHGLAFGGHRLCWVYNPTDNEWADVADLLPEPGKSTGGGRWYPTLLTLGSGEVIAFFGHPRFDDDRHRNTIAETYDATHDTWSQLPQMADPTQYPGGDIRYLMYPRVFQLPDGTLFFATGMPVVDETTYHSTKYDPATGDYVGPQITEPTGYGSGWDYPAVLLPLLPSEEYRARVLFAGNVTPRRIDLGESSPQWAATVDRDGSVSDRRRRNSMAVLLPTGEVCVTGGVHVTDPEEPVLRSELYDPGIDWTAGDYSGTENWSTDEDDAQHARNYHSIALLLPDGTVLTAGGNTNADAGHPDDDITVDGVKKKLGITNIEIYEPPYVAAGGRPTIAAAPEVVSYGQSFVVTTPEAASIQRAALIRYGSATHGHNYDQRYVGLEFERDGDDLYIEAPPNGDVAPPGFYMLWLVDDEGRPCVEAATVRVASLNCDLVLDRSTFGVHEVEALLSETTPAVVPNAVYAVFDGFRPTELGSPPSPPSTALRYADDGSLVDEADMRLRHRETLLEDPEASDDAVQRVTYIFDVEFGSLAAFEDLTESRNVRVDVEHAGHECSATMVLTDQPNPYMLDIDADIDNPHWLSVDLRVLSLTEDEVFNVASGVNLTQGSDATAPNTFLQSALQAFEDNPGSFESKLPTDQQTSALELARTVNGKRVYNYAVAQVRYRALSVDADNVQVFFRMFTTAATNLRYDPSSTYRRAGDWPNNVPLLGKVSGELVSVPFFAEPRVNTTAGGVSMETQTDPLNRRTVEAGGAGEVTEYFGAWLDFNQTTPRFPILPNESDGPFTGGTPLTQPRSIQELIRGQHQCLAAEIRFQPGPTDPIPTQAGPAQSDRIAQRNLMIVESDNPGGPASRTVAHTFELSPSPQEPVGYPTGAPLGRLDAANHAQPAMFARRKRWPWPDELLIRWGSIPAGSEVELTLADHDVDEIMRLAATRQGAPVLRKVDALTLGLTVGEATWIPLSGPADENIAALLSIRLPDGVEAGDHYTASVSQVSGPLRTVLGSWQLSIPVTKASKLRAKEVRTLSVLRHIGDAIPPENRWNPIFDRYVDVVAGRVEAFGNDPDLVLGNPNGDGTPWEPVDDQDRPHEPDPDLPVADKDSARGKVVRIEYDACGCFQGFVLRDCDGERLTFRSTDGGVERVVRKACADGLRVVVRAKRGRIVDLEIDCC